MSRVKKVIEKVIGHISDCMFPIIPVLVASGLIKLLVILLVKCNLLIDGSQTEQILTAIGGASLYFLPFLVAYTASWHFHVNTLLCFGAVGAMLSPDFIELANASDKIIFAGIPVLPSEYSYSTIPVILLVVIMVYVERLVHRFVPQFLDDVISPLLILIISSILGLTVVGPMGVLLGKGLSGIIFYLQECTPVLAWGIYAAITPILNMTGTHWVFVAVVLNDIGKTGVDNGLMVGFFILSLSQAGTAFAVCLKAKSAKVKKMALGIGITVALTGVTKPPVFGICLKYKWPLLTSMIGAGIAGIYQGIVTIHCYVYAFAALPSCLMFASDSEPDNLMKALIAAGIAFIVSFVLTLIYPGRIEEKMEITETN